MDLEGALGWAPAPSQLKCCRYFGSCFQSDAVLQPKKKANLCSKTASMMNSWEKSAKLPGIFRKTSHKCHYPAVCDDCPMGRHLSSSPRWHGLPHRPPPHEWELHSSGDEFQVVEGQISTSGNSEPLKLVVTVPVPALQRPVEWFSVLDSVGLTHQSKLCHESSHRHVRGRPPSAGFRGRFSVSR